MAQSAVWRGGFRRSAALRRKTEGLAVGVVWLIDAAALVGLSHGAELLQQARRSPHSNLLECIDSGSAPTGERMPIRILIADDHSVVRQGLRMFLALDPELEVVGEAQNGAEALKLALEIKPDVVLMDLLMPVMDGITAIGEIRTQLPDTEVIALTSVLEDASVVGAVKAGAIGYLLKDTQSDELCRAIKAAAAGQVQLSPQAAARLMREVRAPDSPEVLTERETDVLRLLARGLANKEIARDLGIGEKTVKTHVSSVLLKLNVRSRTQAALYAAQIGLAPLETSSS
jgi:DNA-binding NarL/FixJ family response regulator